MAKNTIYDRKFRSELISNPKKELKKISFDIIEDIDYKVIESTKDITYFVIPQQDNTVDLSNISAAGKSIPVSSAACAGSVGTVCTCVGTFGTVSSNGSVDVGIRIDSPI